MRRYIECLQGPRVVLGLSRRAEKGLEAWREQIAGERSRRSAGEDALFYSSRAHGRRIPRNLDVAYLLNLFRHLRGESLTLDDLVTVSGLDRGRILMYCGRLEGEGFLLLDPQRERYRVNPDRASEVDRVLKPLDERRAELVAKVRDIERFGKPLALCSERIEARAIATGIDGLDLVLAPFGTDSKGLPLRKVCLVNGPPGSGKTTLALEILKNVRGARLPEETALYLTFEEDVERLLDDYRLLAGAGTT